MIEDICGIIPHYCIYYHSIILETSLNRGSKRNSLKNLQKAWTSPDFLNLLEACSKYKKYNFSKQEKQVIRPYISGYTKVQKE